MKYLRIAANELIGMFIDDSSLALWSVLLIAIVSVVVLWLGLPALWGGVLLVAGCILILTASGMRAARR